MNLTECRRQWYIMHRAKGAGSTKCSWPTECKIEECITQRMQTSSGTKTVRDQECVMLWVQGSRMCNACIAEVGVRSLQTTGVMNIYHTEHCGQEYVTVQGPGVHNAQCLEAKSVKHRMECVMCRGHGSGVFITHTLLHMHICTHTYALLYTHTTHTHTNTLFRLC